MNKVWLIEKKEKGEWYPCWYDVYYSKKESIQALDKLITSGGNGFYEYPRFYRTARYERVKK